MTLKLLHAHTHTGLVRHLPPDHNRRCTMNTHNRYLPRPIRCRRRARWQVKGRLPQCGQHAAITLRKLQDAAA